jgi:hypothetical protein
MAESVRGRSASPLEAAYAELLAKPSLTPATNRLWVAACDIKPEFSPGADNGALAEVDFAAYEALLTAPPPSQGGGADGDRVVAQSVFVPTAALPRFLETFWPRVHASRRVVLVSGLADAGPVRTLSAAADAAAATADAAPSAPPAGGAEPIQPADGMAEGAGAVPRSPAARHVLPPARAPLRRGEGRLAFLDDARLLGWRAENLDLPFPHEKVAPLPIGVDFHTLAFKPDARPVWGAPAEPAAQAAALRAAAAAAAARDAVGARDPRVYVAWGVLNRRRLALSRAVAGHACFAVEESPLGSLPREALWARMAARRWVAIVSG